MAATADLKKQVETKRKANAFTDADEPQPRLRHRGSLLNLHRFSECYDPKKSVPNIMRKSFIDPENIGELAPCFIKQIQSVIKKDNQKINKKSRKPLQ